MAKFAQIYEVGPNFSVGPVGFLLLLWAVVCPVSERRQLVQWSFHPVLMDLHDCINR